MSIWTDHPSATDNPQGYWAHGMFAGRNSAIIFVASLAGMVHAVLPFLFPFYTSTVIIRSFKKLVHSKRHEPELRRELPGFWLSGNNDVDLASARVAFEVELAAAKRDFPEKSWPERVTDSQIYKMLEQERNKNT